ncbi:hypothetical protein AOLI_G00189380 [Acnodon oligacanthus]
MAGLQWSVPAVSGHLWCSSSLTVPGMTLGYRTMHKTLFQHCLVGFLLLLCFGVIFYIYNKPTMSWVPCPEVTVSIHDVCTDECFDVFKRENLTQNINNTCSLNYTLMKQQTNKQFGDTEETNRKLHQSDTIVLIWDWPFGQSFDVGSCAALFGITGCYLTADRSFYYKAHGVMFHLRDIYGDLPNLQKMPRPPQQKWVWMNMESPDNAARLVALDLFNLTSNYRRDSDVWVPYGQIVEASEEDKVFQMPEKNKLVCWIVSNWNNNFKRVKYFNELRQYIKIEAYGRYFRKYVSDENYPGIMSSCKFYLSFENSIHKDYITEKLFNPMKLGTVPVVLGPSRENYEEFIPKDSFIHVDDFKTPQELAEHLKRLDQNQEMYEQYFSWRKHFVARSSYFGLEHACRICGHVKRNKGYRVFKNLDKWYWG